MRFNEFQVNVLAWAAQRDILKYSDAKTQILKGMSEFGELADNTIKGKDTIDDYGDVIVTLILAAAFQGVDMEAAFDHAWNEIKDRTGHMTPEGAFVKDE